MCMNSLRICQKNILHQYRLVEIAPFIYSHGDLGHVFFSVQKKRCGLIVCNAGWNSFSSSLLQ